MKVFIINDQEHPRGAIMEDLRKEDFTHLFKFCDDVHEDDLETYLLDADEVWTFGEVKDSEAYQLGLTLGVDVWVMD